MAEQWMPAQSTSGSLIYMYFVCYTAILHCLDPPSTDNEWKRYKSSYTILIRQGADVSKDKGGFTYSYIVRSLTE